MAPVYVWSEEWTLLPRELATPGRGPYLPMCVHPPATWCWGESLLQSKRSEHYFRWKAWMSCRTSSQMWGSLNLPRFLYRDESLTLVNMTSMTVLVILCASLPTMEKLSTLMQYSEDWSCSYIWDWALRCSLSLSLKILPNPPMYSSSQPTWVHLTYR